MPGGDEPRLPAAREAPVWPLISFGGEGCSRSNRRVHISVRVHVQYGRSSQTALRLPMSVVRRSYPLGVPILEA